MRIRNATERDLNSLSALLAAAQQPDLDADQAVSDVFVAENDGTPIGCIALQVYGRSGVVRSLVVAESRRNEGVGRNLWQRLLSRANELGLESLWLLTLDASGFFARFGFKEARRADAPNAIAQGDLFRSHATDDATCMRKRLELSL